MASSYAGNHPKTVVVVWECLKLCPGYFNLRASRSVRRRYVNAVTHQWGSKGVSLEPLSRTAASPQATAANWTTQHVTCIVMTRGGQDGGYQSTSASVDLSFPPSRISTTDGVSESLIVQWAHWFQCQSISKMQRTWGGGGEACFKKHSGVSRTSGVERLVFVGDEIPTGWTGVTGLWIPPRCFCYFE